MTERIKVAVLGAGSWGTALANHLVTAGHECTIWGRDRAVLETIKSEHRNKRYFPDLDLRPELAVSFELAEAIADADMVVFAVPAPALPEVLAKAKPAFTKETLVISTAKGLHEHTLEPMSTVLEKELGALVRVAVLSGPSFAREVLLGLPTAVTMAARTIETANAAAGYFQMDCFRVYTSLDVAGVEFGGVVKNVIALAAGVVEGMGMGSNARAALITRGLVEMQRLSIALGGAPNTTMGLSGLGDLFLTATGDLSRNRQVGLRLGRGEKLPDILSSLGQVAEAVKVAPKIAELARRHHVRTPIIEEVDKILAGTSRVEDSVRTLLSRTPGAEH